MSLHPHDTVDPLSFKVPFDVANRSAWISMNKVTLGCGIRAFFFADADGKTGLIKGMMFYSPDTVAIPHNEPVKYYCSAERYVHVQPDGSMIIGAKVPLDLPNARSSGLFRPPLTILKMCMWIGGDYKIFGVVTHRFTTPIFQWPVEPGVDQ